MIYQNRSSATKTFYGVTFKPGETKEVTGIINHPQFVSVESLPKEPAKVVEKKIKPQEETPSKLETKEEK